MRFQACLLIVDTILNNEKESHIVVFGLLWGYIVHNSLEAEFWCLQGAFLSGFKGLNCE